MMEVAELWRYPVSSAGGERMPALDVSADGVAGDRLFGIAEAESAQVAAPDKAPRWRKVPEVRTRLGASEALEIALPGADWMPAPSDEADKAISEHLHGLVRLRRFGEPDGAEAIVPRYRKAPIHLVTMASFASLARLHPRAQSDARRFRPNIVVDLPFDGELFPESAWLGRRLAVGELELTVSEPCRRCGFTIIAQQDLPEDPEILRTLVRNNKHNFGVYCTVDRPGQVRVGDPVRLLASEAPRSRKRSGERLPAQASPRFSSMASGLGILPRKAM